MRTLLWRKGLRYPILILLIIRFVAACGDGADHATTAAPTTASPLIATTTSEAREPTATTSTITVAPPTTAPPTTTSSPPSTAPATTMAPPAGLEDLVPGHNNARADRINLVFAPWGWEDLDAFDAFARSVITWDGHPILIGPDTWPNIDTPEEPALGLFGFEPFRSNRDKFNVWITMQSPLGPHEWIDADDHPDFISDQIIVTIARATRNQDYQSRSGAAFPFQNPEETVREGTDLFPNVTVVLRPGEAFKTFRTIPHELGHALFGLPDEYLGREGFGDSAAGSRYPSCAASLQVAEEWWGDMVGSYDPMIDIYIDEMIKAGFQDWIDGHTVPITHYMEEAVPADEVALFTPTQMRDTNRTGYFENGCEGAPDSYRSAEDTMMGYRISPAFGLTNRHRMEEILDLWTGS